MSGIVAKCRRGGRYEPGIDSLNFLGVPGLHFDGVAEQWEKLY